MARIEGVTRGGSLLARFAFWLCRRRVGKVIAPFRIKALHSKLFWGYLQMERSQDQAARIDETLKSLANIHGLLDQLRQVRLEVPHVLNLGQSRELRLQPRGHRKACIEDIWLRRLDSPASLALSWVRLRLAALR